jgi:hypothetical protein
MSNQPGTILTALHYLFSHKGAKTVAHCLDLDLVTSGDNLEQAEVRLNAVVLQQIAACYMSGNFEQLCFKAPGQYWNTLSSARELERAHLEVEVPPVVLPVSRRVVSLPVYRHQALEALQAAQA